MDGLSPKPIILKIQRSSESNMKKDFFLNLLLKNLSKSEWKRIWGILWSFGLLLMLPALLPATFIHEFGHGLIGLILFPGKKLSLNYLIGFYSGSGYAIYWWQDLLESSMGMIFSTVALYISLKFFIPRIPSEKLYRRLFLQIFTLGCWVMGPLYLAGAFFLPFSDVTIPARSLNWVLGTKGINISTLWILSSLGIALSIFSMKRFAHWIAQDVDFLLKQFSVDCSNKSLRDYFAFLWVVLVLVIMLIYRLLATYLLQNTLYQTLSDPWIWYFWDGTVFYRIIATFCLIGFLFLIYFVNKRILFRISVDYSEKNLKLFTLLVIFLIPIFFTQQIPLSDPNWFRKDIPDEYDRIKPANVLIEYYPAFMNGMGSPYRLVFYQNQSNYPNADWSTSSYGLSLRIFNESSYKYSDPALLLQNLSSYSQIPRMSYTIDNSNRCWLCAVELVNPMMTGPTESKLILRSWSLSNEKFSTQYVEPDFYFDFSYLNLNITREFQCRVEFDGINNLLWLFFTNSTLKNATLISSPDGLESTFIERFQSIAYVTTMNLTNLQWSQPIELNSTISNLILFPSNYLKFNYYSNQTFGFYQLRYEYPNKFDLIHWQPDSQNLTANWILSPLIPKEISDSINLEDWIYINNQIIFLYRYGRDLWVTRIDLEDPTNLHKYRVTWNYPDYLGYFILLSDRLYVYEQSNIVYSSSKDQNYSLWNMEG
jgi:hypothetical protein